MCLHFILRDAGPPQNGWICGETPRGGSKAVRSLSENSSIFWGTGVPKLFHSDRATIKVLKHTFYKCNSSSNSMGRRSSREKRIPPRPRPSHPENHQHYGPRGVLSNFEGGGSQSLSKERPMVLDMLTRVWLVRLQPESDKDFLHLGNFWRVVLSHWLHILCYHLGVQAHEGNINVSKYGFLSVPSAEERRMNLSLKPKKIILRIGAK